MVCCTRTAVRGLRQLQKLQSLLAQQCAAQTESRSHSRRFRSLLGRVGAALMAPAALVSGTFAYIGITVAVAVLGFLYGKARSVSRDNLE